MRWSCTILLCLTCSSNTAVNHATPNHQIALRGSRLDIFLNTLALSAPMILSSAAFIALILAYQVRLESDSNIHLFPVTNATADPRAYYVQLDSTLLIIAASWMSTLAPLLSGFAIALATYPIAQEILRHSEASQHQSLPTPFQLTLVLRLIDGSTWSTLWNLLLYNEAWKRRADRHAAALASLSALTLLTMFLSFLVFAADTWLHVATTTQSIQKVIPLRGHLPSYSLMLDPGCTLTNNSYAALNATHSTCALDIDYPSTLANGYPALQVLNNQSDDMSVLTTQLDSEQPLYYLGVPFTSRNEYHDFTAKTFALQTSCKPISRECNLNMTSGSFTTLDCNGNYSSNDSSLTSWGLYQKAFRYPNFGDGGDLKSHFGFDNPVYYGVAIQTAIMHAVPSSLLRDPELVTDATSLAIVLACNATVLDATYDQVQGEVKRFDTTPSNVSTANAIVSAASLTMFGFSNLQAWISLESLEATSAQDFADRFAKLLSTTILSGAAGSVTSIPATFVQQRQPLLVSRLPKAPFFLLICTNFCFPMLALVLSVLAARTTEDARQVRHRLSVAGVVASRFDTRQARLPVNNTDEMFGEFYGRRSAGRIGFNRSISGGFEFHAFRDDQVALRKGESDGSLRRSRSGSGSLGRGRTLRGSSPGLIC